MQVSLFNILPWDWDANIRTLQDRMKSRIDEVSELKKFVASLNVGNIDNVVQHICLTK